MERDIEREEREKGRLVIGSSFIGWENEGEGQ